MCSYVTVCRGFRRFPNIGIPPNHLFSLHFPLKTIRLGIPPFMETSILLLLLIIIIIIITIIVVIIITILIITIIVIK